MNDLLPTVGDNSPTKIPVRRSEATAIEISRAVAEVQAALVVAQQRPRDKSAALAEMREVTDMKELAERAFFSFNRGGSNVAGASIHLARELARCWGNINYGVMELGRDDVHAQSEMRAFAWDLQTNAYRSTTFIVPHLRDTKGGSKVLTDQRDIYENNANNAARRLRECIYSVLPVWFTEEAKARCTKTIKDGGGVPLITRIANTIEAYGKMGVTKAQLEQRQGRKSDAWTDEDYASLRVLYGTIKNGETTVSDEFDKGAPDLPENADAFERSAAGQQPSAGAPDQTETPAEAQKRRGRPTNAEKAAREAAEKAAAEAQKQTDAAPEQTQTDAKVSIDVVDQHGQVTTYGTEGLAINELRRLINGAEDEDAVIAIRNANGPFLGKHPDLAQTAQNRLNAFVAARQADGEQEAADEDPREADYDDGLPGLAVADSEPNTAAPGIDITLMMEDGKTAKTFSIPAQAAEYESEFRRVFTAIAERRSVSEYNAAVQPHGKEVNKLKADPAHEALVGRLRAMLGEIGKIVTSPRPAPGGTSEVH